MGNDVRLDQNPIGTWPDTGRYYVLPFFTGLYHYVVLLPTFPLAQKLERRVAVHRSRHLWWIAILPHRKQCPQTDLGIQCGFVGRNCTDSHRSAFAIPAQNRTITAQSDYRFVGRPVRCRLRRLQRKRHLANSPGRRSAQPDCRRDLGPL